MSYILSAIKQAERERELAQKYEAPVVPTAGNLETPPRIRPWIWIGLALILNITVVTIMLWRPETSSDVVLEPAPLAKENIDEVPRDTPSLSDNSPPLLVASSETTTSSPSLPAVATTRDKIQGTEGRASVSPSPEPTTNQQTVSPGTSAATLRTQPNPSDLSEPAPGERVAHSGDSSGHLSRTLSNASPPAAPPSKSSVNSRSQPIQNMPTKQELEIETANYLPGLSINVHYFSDESRQRFVRINMRKYHEGSRLDDFQAVVKEITRQGIILDFGDRLVHFIYGT